MPVNDGFWLNDDEGPQDCWIPTVKLDEEPAVVIGESNAAMHLAPQNDQLMSERRVLGFKSALRLEG